MGGFLHLIDQNQGRMARKVVAHKRHVGGLEAPRNSLELPEETSQSYCFEEDDEPQTCQVPEDWSEKHSYPTEAPIKKLIREEIAKRPNTRSSAPSIVARLMGVDVLPLDTKIVAQPAEKSGPKSSTDKQARNGSVGHAPASSKSSRQIMLDSFHQNKDRDPDRWSGSMKSTRLDKPRPREHPQEEELQKFKKDFEAWQAARLMECSKVVERASLSSQWVAQEKLNKEKMVLYANSGRMTSSENPGVLDRHDVKASAQEIGDSEHRAYKSDVLPAVKREPLSTRSSRMPSRDIERSALVIPEQKLVISSAPTKIVILRPGPDNICNNEESWASSSGTSEDRGGIEDFLAEVKERLKCELQGKSLKTGMVRGCGIETPYSEKPSDPKQIAQRIAKQVRESVTRDLGMNLLRSESTRSYRSDIQYTGTGSPEFITRDTGRYLSERLRNVMNRETRENIARVMHNSSSSSILGNRRCRPEQSRDILNAENNVSYWNSTKAEQDMQSRSFRCGPDEDSILHKELSPRSLVRSMSAPVAGTSFGKLLLEDRRILTGAHIRRRHEAIEKVMKKVNRQKKEKFNLREKVSSLKYSFTLRGRLFGRKTLSAEESRINERDFIKDIMSGPTVMMNFSERHENSTEVPPSPASVCSSVHEEFWRPAEHLCPTSTSDIPPSEDNSLPDVFREISSNLSEGQITLIDILEEGHVGQTRNIVTEQSLQIPCRREGELRRQLNHLETYGSEETTIEEQPLQAEMELEDQAEAYLRDLLVASGLYDGSSDKSLSRRDPFAKPVCNRVFEEVEESYRKRRGDDEGSTKDNSEKNVDHKLLLDLLNEALSTVLGPRVAMSKFRIKAFGTMLRPPRGKKLLDRVWEIIRAYVYPSADKSYPSLDSMIDVDLQSTPWLELMNDDIEILGKEMEGQIIRDLIEEIVQEMLTIFHVHGGGTEESVDTFSGSME
ncbi:hypothetical protein RJ639_042798 [Escallonia herrerae]|uniref:DUF4378 domain-containing protein n=1 Tax=Escallonia herrerae TaxID=1293975 RepID=A0AA88WD54_9ASTE|nr:hypothetical protein RJ639_042798 [Escallonia herrerae]